MQAFFSVLAKLGMFTVTDLQTGARAFVAGHIQLPLRAPKEAVHGVPPA